MMFAAVVHDKVSGTIRDHGYIADVSRCEQVTFQTCTGTRGGTVQVGGHAGDVA
jgi:hypothetical protein